MAQPTYGKTMNQAAYKWRDLAERRRDHFVELFETGRWRHYYTERTFFAALREASEAAERWARLAPRPEDEVPLYARPVAMPAKPAMRRRAA